jgi:hypothetical protein
VQGEPALSCQERLEGCQALLEDRWQRPGFTG